MGFHPLRDLNVPIDYKNFDPKRSDVSMSLGVPNPPHWKPTQPTSKMWNSENEVFLKARSDRRFFT